MLYDRWRAKIAFFVIYIKEAHPEDGWVLEVNRDQGVAVKDPVSLEARVEVAQSCAIRLEIRIPVLLDGVANKVAIAYGGWPDRLYLISKSGKVAFQGAEGPFGFKPEQLEQAIERELAAS
jgi:hypothetical protein